MIPYQLFNFNIIDIKYRFALAIWFSNNALFSPKKRDIDPV